MEQLGEPRRARGRAEYELQYGDLKILAGGVTILCHPDRRGFQCGQPPDLLDAFPDAPLVDGCGRTVFDEKRLRHSTVDKRAGGEGESRNGIEWLHTGSVRQHDEERHDLEIVDAGELTC